MDSTDAATLDTIRSTPDYRGFLAEVLDHDVQQLAAARVAVDNAQRTQRVDAALAVRGGMSKVEVAARLSISRPTLDAWLAIVESRADEIESVEQHERFLLRNHARTAGSA